MTDQAVRSQRLEQIARTADKLLDAAAEFLPEYPDALSEWLDALATAVARLDAPEWVVDSRLGDNSPLTQWRCTGCGKVVGCYRKPADPCETCAENWR